ncbi:MAG: hypothetical protein SFX73_05950 [Kofleriaceae bacterium]|nr:hypothetical protein [Kofleriaceae bacterium]
MDNHSGLVLGAGAAPMFALALVVALGACDDGTRRTVVPEAAPVANRAAADPTLGVSAASPNFHDAVLAELIGDEVGARVGYDRVLASTSVPPAVAARAALHLAKLEAQAGQHGHARELAVRAAALAPNDPVISEGSVHIRSDTAGATETEIRGPRLGSGLPGVPAIAAKQFSDAERALAGTFRIQPRPVIETLSSSIRAKEHATEAVVARFHAVAAHGGLAQIASSYRAGTLYHDLALALLFELPSELDPSVAAGLRRTLRGRALGYLHKAVAEYRLALTAPAAPGADPWLAAAQRDLRSVQDILDRR